MFKGPGNPSSMEMLEPTHKGTCAYDSCSSLTVKNLDTPKYLSRGDKVHTPWCIHRAEFSAVIKKNVLHTGTDMEELSHSINQKGKMQNNFYTVVPFMEKKEKPNTHKKKDKEKNISNS